VGRAAAADAVGPGATVDAEGTAIARGRGEAVCIAADVPAWKLGAMSAAVPWPLAVSRPDTSNAVATAAVMRRTAAAQAAMPVRKLVSSSRELIASRSLARPAGRG
jgi:hypothetical protein